MMAWSGNIKMLSSEFLMFLILLLVIKTINASTLPSSSLALNELSRANNKCEQITVTNCPELKYNQTTTMISSDADDLIGHGQKDEANDMVRGSFDIHMHDYCFKSQEIPIY